MDALCFSMAVKANIQEYDLFPIEEQGSVNEEERSKGESVEVSHASESSNFQAAESKIVQAAEQEDFQAAEGHTLPAEILKDQPGISSKDIQDEHDQADPIQEQ